ncbi:phage tail protein [Cohaesibacter sp. CAU 1516]|uniref:phage tail protein n=1 Tax=Cohaesibacter sp. CAU 1516 TaxID=2576038 RepID=UPI0010FCDFE5|nr:phage tail protein [Cohaesibacter sp. CAU 1516]TLP42678.1 phage tail protein [Cohaesibacter sp. CAU 1516]
MSLASLLPSNATPWERAMADAMAMPQVLHNAIGTMRGFKHDHPSPSFLLPLIIEYGLTELTPYIANQYTLVNEGPDWTRVRSSDGAVALGLGWLDLVAEIEKARPTRTYWNQITLLFSSLPGNDDPLLEQIEGVTRLSMAMRSDLWRGVFAYDVRAAEADGARLDNAMLDFSSGIRVKEGGAIWSFGRTWEADFLLSQAVGEALDLWIDEPVDENAGLTWADADIPWGEANFPWVSDAVAQRRLVMMSQLKRLTYLVGLFDEAGEAIGYRRVRAVHPVGVAVDGAYQFNGVSLAPSEAGDRLYVEALTAFDDADLMTAHHIALIAEADIAEGTLPGRMWLTPDLVSGGVEMARQAVEIPLRKTVREQLKFQVRV